MQVAFADFVLGKRREVDQVPNFQRLVSARRRVVALGVLGRSAGLIGAEGGGKHVCASRVALAERAAFLVRVVRSRTAPLQWKR